MLLPYDLTVYIRTLHTLKYHTYTNIQREFFFVLNFSLLIVKLKLLHTKLGPCRVSNLLITKEARPE